MEAAPFLFSTITARPPTCMCCATMRATVSGAPPGGAPTTIRIVPPAGVSDRAGATKASNALPSSGASNLASSLRG